MRLQPEITPGMMLPDRLPRGFVLDDLVVEGWLRDGATAAVYRARRSSDGRTVAVKLQLPTTTRDPILGERFEREAETLWRLRGTPYVIDLVDVGMLEDGRRYLVLEWMEGGDLDDLLELLGERDQLLPVLRACRIARDVARGLAALHERGFVHLDLEAPNVMLGSDGHGRDRVALVDLASAADLRELATFEDVVPGNPPHEVPSHVSPQRAHGGAPSASCDVFALGVLMFEAISGACAPPEGWPLDTLPRLDTLRHGVPPALADLVQACMSREVGPRPASAKVVAGVLDAIVIALEASEGAGWAGVEDAVRWPLRAANAPGETEATEEDGRTGDTLLGIPVRQVIGSHPAEESRPQPAASPPPPQFDDPEVAMWARLTAANHAPPPPTVAEPRAGDTEIAMRLPPILDGESTAGDTKVAMHLPLAVVDPSLRPDDTWELVPMTRPPEPDPDDTEVAMPLPYDRVDPEDTAATMELVRDDVSQGLALLAPGPQDSVDVVHHETPEDSTPSELEWLAHEQRWWVRWAIAAGVLLVVGGTGAWLVTRDADEATVPLTAVTSAVAAEASLANAVAGERPSIRGDGWGSAHERERMETRTGSHSVPPPAMEAAPEGAEPAEVIAMAIPDADRPAEAPTKVSPVNEPACQQARARAVAGRSEREWETVLAATLKRRCWSTSALRVERARLRVTAFAELGQLEQCITAGAKIRDREVADRTTLCRKKLDEVEAQVEPEA
jgi:serine/threonine protein kinase